MVYKKDSSDHRYLSLASIDETIEAILKPIIQFAKWVPGSIQEHCDHVKNL